MTINSALAVVSNDTPNRPELFPSELLVSIEDEQVFTTSLLVAEYFGKRHDNVLRAMADFVVAATRSSPKATPRNSTTATFA